VFCDAFCGDSVIRKTLYAGKRLTSHSTASKQRKAPIVRSKLSEALRHSPATFAKKKVSVAAQHPIMMVIVIKTDFVALYSFVAILCQRSDASQPQNLS